MTSEVWSRVGAHLASPRAPGQRERPPSGYYTPRRIAQLLPLAMPGQRVDTCLLAYGAARRAGLSHDQAVEAVCIWARNGGLRQTRMARGLPGETVSLDEFLEDGIIRICEAARAGYRAIRTKRLALHNLTKSEILNLRRLALRASQYTDTPFRAAMTMAVEFASLQRAARAAGLEDTRLRARRLGAEDPNLGWEDLAGGLPQYAKLRAALGIQRTAKHCRGIAAAAYTLPYRPGDEPLVPLGDGSPAQRLERACEALNIDPSTGERTRAEVDPADQADASQARNTSSPRGSGPSGGVGALSDPGPRPAPSDSS